MFHSVRLYTTLTILAISFLVPFRIYAAPESIPAFTSDILIQKSGIVTVRETIVYDFGPEDHHGIIRKIPIIY